ncbi:hypothetical protein C7H09_05330 [Marinobacter fuscus]|uniref:Uncharacterized protein n=1 Tax=Marinobacter fuscus TaxID=2109942 RepID=A0A2T1KPL7_9GAMM|nr:hypothetical protein C7H09_05330 [Marinobacter fuscus]
MCGRFPGPLRCEALSPMVQLVVGFEYPVERRLRGQVQPLVYQRWHDLRRRQALIAGRVTGRQDLLALCFTELVGRPGAHSVRALIGLNLAFTEPAAIGTQANASFSTGLEQPGSGAHGFLNQVDHYPALRDRG